MCPAPLPSPDGETAPLPVITPTDWGLLVRTDFGDDRAWAALAADVDRLDLRYETPGNHYTCVQIVDDPAFAGATPEQVTATLRRSEDHDQAGTDVVVIADRASMEGSDHTVLVVPLKDDGGWYFRLPLEDVRIMVINLFLANNDVEDWREQGVEEDRSRM